MQISTFLENLYNGVIIPVTTWLCKTRPFLIHEALLHHPFEEMSLILVWCKVSLPMEKKLHLMKYNRRSEPAPVNKICLVSTVEMLVLLSNERLILRFT